MGVTGTGLLVLIQSLGSVLGCLSGALSMDSWILGGGGGGGGERVCRECFMGFGVLGGRGLRCRGCRRLFCKKCMQGSGPEEKAEPKFCRFCFRALSHAEVAAVTVGERAVDPAGPPDSVPVSPLLRFSDNKFANLVDSQQGPSPRSLCSSAYRSEDDEDGDDGGKNFFSPKSMFSQDHSDVDNSSISTGHDIYSFRSMSSSPLDSPIRAGEQGENSPHKIGLLDQEALGYLRRPGVESEDVCIYDNLSVYSSAESEKAQQPLDFENDGVIWCPPPPEAEEDDVENRYFGFADDDDNFGESGMNFSSGSFGCEASPIKEKQTDATKNNIKSAICDHFRALVSELLKTEGICAGHENGGEGWLEIITSLAWQAANFVRPDTSKGGSMDPGDHVKVKCIASGNPGDSTLIKGVVCTKNIAHKRMLSQQKNPRILILGGALEYQRVANKLASLNTILEEESNHLELAVKRIEAHRPNVLLVEKSVSSYAQKCLLRNEISLVLNVKRSLLERISRCTGAQITSSTDNLASAKIGHCEMFRTVKVFEGSPEQNKKSSKTLLYFEGCPKRLGCTVLLRGTSIQELKKIKHVIQYASFAAYHLSLETSFLEDEGATLPNVSSKPPISIPEKFTNVDSNMSATSGSAISDVRLTVIDKDKEVNSCSNAGQKLLLPYSDVPSLRENTPDINLQPGRDMVSSAPNQSNDVSAKENYKINGDSAVDFCLNLSSYKDVNISANFWNIDEKNGASIDKGTEVSRDPSSTAENHESILVSLSSRCVLKGTVCERSQLFRIKFYGSFDKPLGRYLRDDVFDQTSFCNSCKESPEAHVRCYTHKRGSLTISVKRLLSVKLPGETDGKIWMWHRCLKCKRKEGVPPASRRVVMSDAAWGISFGKFLELSFSDHATANRIAICGHSLQRDCLRFYGFGSTVAFFRYSPVDILSVNLPPSVLDFTCETQQEWVRREATDVLKKLHLLHTEVADALHTAEQNFKIWECEPVKTSIQNHIMELMVLLERERRQYEVLLQPDSEKNHPVQTPMDILELNRLRRGLLIDSYKWNRLLYVLDSFSKEKSPTPKVDPDLPELPNPNNWKELKLENENSTEEAISKPSAMLVTAGDSSLPRRHEEMSLQVLECQSNTLVDRDFSIESVDGYVGAAGLNLVCGQRYALDAKPIGAETCTSSLERLQSSNLSEKIDLAWSGTAQLVTDSSIVGSEAHSHGLSMLNNLNYKKVMSPVRFCSFDSVMRLQDRINRGLSPASLSLSSVKSFDTSGNVAGLAQHPSPIMGRFYSQRIPNDIHGSIMPQSHNPTFISSASHMLNEGVRLLLPPSSIDDVVIAVYENEPTSIISYAILSQEYNDFVTSKCNRHEGLNGNAKVYGARTDRQSTTWFQSDDNQSQSYKSDEPRPSQADNYVDVKESHLRVSFDDDSSFPADKVKFSVICYFAKQFHALRKKCWPNELDFIRSMSRCKTWSAQGGKSNVYFAKSLDERFIIKQVTKTELDSFEEFAPEYFKYLMESLSSGSPTCLAKVLGIYQVTVKHIKGGREVKMDLMVMENLFYRKHISRIYDLKGSVRSRYNPDTSGKNKVLLDLNLLETLRTKPIFLGSKAKRCLERAVWNDTSFLASVDVMDYSLLVGVDEERKELVIGIIDFVRQYTWDKQLETWVKASGILGGPKNALPTVISPLQYKKRFRKAMSNYFLTVPDHWPG